MWSVFERSLWQRLYLRGWRQATVRRLDVISKACNVESIKLPEASVRCQDTLMKRLRLGMLLLVGVALVWKTPSHSRLWHFDSLKLLNCSFIWTSFWMLYASQGTPSISLRRHQQCFTSCICCVSFCIRSAGQCMRTFVVVLSALLRWVCNGS